MQAYDIVGDVHGTGDKLTGLLDRLGWVEDSTGVRRHRDPLRQVVFVGDLIDRGEDHRGVLSTVRAMVEHGTAQVVMGNHEFNAISYSIERPAGSGNHLRPHTPKNDRQHQAFLDQLDAEERSRWIEWFAGLPLWLDLGGVRVVHACWHQPSIDLLTAVFGGNRFPDGAGRVEAFADANRAGHATWAAIEVLLKGPEIELSGYGLPPYRDKGGDRRAAARVAWWNGAASTVRDLVDLPHDTTDEAGAPYPAIPALPATAHDRSFAYPDAVPVVYGHHWRQWEPSEHHDWTPRTACVDFSAGKSGPLVAYRWRGESEIDPAHYVRFPEDP